MTLKNITVVRKQWTTGREVGIDPSLPPSQTAATNGPPVLVKKEKEMGGGTGGRRAGSKEPPEPGGDLYRRLTGSQACPSPRSRLGGLDPQLRPRGLLPILHLPLPLGHHWARGAPLPLSTVPFKKGLVILHPMHLSHHTLKTAGEKGSGWKVVSRVFREVPLSPTAKHTQLPNKMVVGGERWSLPGFYPATSTPSLAEVGG